MAVRLSLWCHGSEKLQPSPVLSVQVRLRTPVPTLRVDGVCSRHESDAARRSKHGAILYGPTATKVRSLCLCLFAIHTYYTTMLSVCVRVCAPSSQIVNGIVCGRVVAKL